MFWKKRKKQPKEISPSTEQEKNRIAESILALKYTISDNADTNRRQESREDRGNKSIQIATLVFVILTTAGIFYQATILNKTDIALHDSAIATKNAADAAKSSADATASIERPYLFVTAKPTKAATKDGPNETAPTITYSVLNLGRVPALIHWISVQCVVVDNIGPAPMYPRNTFHDTLREIGSGATDTNYSPCQFQNSFSSTDWSDIQNGNKLAIFLSAIVFEGALDYTYYTTFGYKIDLFSGDSFAVGGSRYNRNGNIEGRTGDGIPAALPDVVP